MFLSSPLLGFSRLFHMFDFSFPSFNFYSHLLHSESKLLIYRCFPLPMELTFFYVIF